MIGIYCFTNLINGKQYVGQSINIENRKKQHIWRYNNSKDTNYNMPIHSAFRKYGIENFSFEILEECTYEELDDKEKYWIIKKNSLSPKGYNILEGGQTNKGNPEKYICPQCGATKYRYSNLCKDCYNKQLKTKNFIKSEEINLSLIEKILDTSFEQVGKEYGYSSGNSLKKRLIDEGFPGNKESLFTYYYKETGKKHWKQIQKEEKEKRKIENKQKNRSRMVGQYTLEGELVQTYNSTQEAQRNGFSSGHVSECCRGKRKKYKDYIWKYID